MEVVGVVALVTIFKVELQRGLQLVGEKIVVTPVGKPETEKETSRAVPEIKEAVAVVVIVPPCVIVPDAGLSDILKLNGAAKRLVKTGPCTLCLMDSILAEKVYL